MTWQSTAHKLVHSTVSAVFKIITEESVQTCVVHCTKFTTQLNGKYSKYNHNAVLASAFGYNLTPSTKTLRAKLVSKVSGQNAGTGQTVTVRATEEYFSWTRSVCVIL